MYKEKCRKCFHISTTNKAGKHFGVFYHSASELYTLLLWSSEIHGLGLTRVSNCTYNIFWNIEQIAFESNQDMITFFFGKNLLPKIKIFSKDRRFSPYILLASDSLYATHVTQFQDKNEASTYPAAYWFSWGYFNYQNRIREYRTYITKTHGQRTKSCLSKVKNKLI